MSDFPKVVQLQATTPGVPQTGSANISGSLSLSGPASTLKFAQPDSGNRDLLRVYFPSDANTPEFTMDMIDFPNPYGTRINHVVSTGFNVRSERASDPAWYTSMESRFDTNVSHSLSEYHLTYIPPGGTGGYRPLSIYVNSVDDYSEFTCTSSLFTLSDTASVPNLSFEHTNKRMRLWNSSYIMAEVNNVPLLKQVNTSGISYVELLRVDDNNAVALAPAGGVTRAYGVLQLANGSVSAPSLSFASDPNTGLYSYTDNYIGLTCNGTCYALFAPDDFELRSSVPIGWCSGAIPSSLDLNISRLSAGVLGIGNGTGGSYAGTIKLATAIFTNVGAFVSGDKYLVIDASGNIHKSALGPAS